MYVNEKILKHLGATLTPQHFPVGGGNATPKTAPICVTVKEDGKPSQDIWFPNVGTLESDILKTACSLMPYLCAPYSIEVNAVTGQADMYFIARGTFVDANGDRVPSPHLADGYSGLANFYASVYPHVMLECINTRQCNDGARANNYKMYELKPIGHQLHAFYGRIGVESGLPFGRREVQTPYELWQFWPIYMEKIAKGYVDVTADFFGSDPTLREKAQGDLSSDKEVPSDEGNSSLSDSEESQDLYQRLLSYSRHVVEDTFTIQQFTSGQISKARELYNQLMDATDSVEHFNEVLQKLLLFIPRKTRYIVSQFAQKEDDFEDILDREESYLKAMEAVYLNQKPNLPKRKVPDRCFSDYGMTIRYANQEEKQKVMENLAPSLKDHVKHVYHVEWPEKEQKFNDFLDKHKITKTAYHVKRAWHGSGNENWLSILLTGLKTHPTNVAICGKMLGYGVYCALGQDGSEKANGYNSHYGSRWANGNSNTSFLALLTIAYVPQKAKMNSEIHPYSLNDMEQSHKTCVHAYATSNTFLYRDEVCCFYEDAIMVTDLVEFD